MRHGKRQLRRRAAYANACRRTRTTSQHSQPARTSPPIESQKWPAKATTTKEVPSTPSNPTGKSKAFATAAPPLKAAVRLLTNKTSHTAHPKANTRPSKETTAHHRSNMATVRLSKWATSNLLPCSNKRHLSKRRIAAA